MTTPMTTRVTAVAIAAALSIFAGACSKTDEPPLPKIAAESQSLSRSMSIPVLPSTPLPDPIVPKGADAPSPAPGQANDHSSPAFKNGGVPEPRK